MRATRFLQTSEAYPIGNRPHWSTFWSKKIPTYPTVHPGHPLRRVNERMRKTRREWERFHGFGNSRLIQGLLHEIPDWDYADGCPGTTTIANYHFRYFKNKLLFQIIRSGAAVEQRLAEDRMPKIPGTETSRDWDPQIPLFLEDEDESGAAPPAKAVAIDMDEVNDLRMKPMPFSLDRRKQYLTRESMLPRSPTRTRSMVEDFKPKKPMV